MSKITFTDRLKSLFGVSEVGPGFWDELEDALLISDVGLRTAKKIMDSARGEKRIDAAREGIRRAMCEMLRAHTVTLKASPHVIMVVGANGTGKTTSIAKLADYFRKSGKRITLVAADTFRAAAVEQLKVWGERLSLPVVAGHEGADSAAVAFDGVKSAIARGSDVLILDTAGRLHTNKNLMEELIKVKRVVGKAMGGAPHDILLVLDATVGQNGVAQAKVFNEALGLTGVLLAKMDGTAKGGVILTIGDELHLPISFLGTGEDLEDLEPFDPEKFVGGIVE